MRRLILTSLILWACGEANLPAEEGSPADAPAYDLHEWGVFTVARNAGWANLDMKSDWASMPMEFYGSLPRRNLPYRGPVRKPVIYFHAQKPLSLELTVHFTEGLPALWWPAASSHVIGGPRERWDRNFLTFQPRLVELDPKQQFGPAGQRPRRLDLPADHWIQALRKVQASEVFCEGSDGNMGMSWDAERFIYYDGVMKMPPSPSASREGEALVLEVPGDQLWLEVMAVERTGAKLRTAQSWGGWSGVLDAKTRRVKLEMADAGPESLERLGKELVERLTAAGLNRDESEALRAVWKEELFGAEGLTVFYRIPQETYERWLPLEAKPAPGQTVRVGLVLHRHLEPELDARLEKLIRDLESEAFETRESARKELLSIGGPAFPQLEKAAKSADLESARAARAILDTLDARAALWPTPPKE